MATLRRVAGPVSRIVPSRFPPVSVFDTLTDPAELDYLFDIEALTNDRLRTELGELQRVPPEDRRVGAGTSPIMAAFCHPNPDGSRFSDGSYGVYYAALSEETAVLESAYHRERFLKQSSRMPPTVVEMRRYVTTLARPMTRLPSSRQRELLDPDDYSAPQAYARRLRESGAWGLYYPSVRHRGGRCVAVFRPPALNPAAQAGHYRYHWDGSAIRTVERIDAAFTILRS